ncbi:unnamed protein product [Soboliphyme baturini]|uniref:Uncharacterized protein n=1 Tax=Soboliphyme baturini TaxID=241478 RepID=A0A183IAZ2_9BILA|nr:unnamed protein product [Soboliphyme baturini]
MRFLRERIQAIANDPSAWSATPRPYMIFSKRFFVWLTVKRFSAFIWNLTSAPSNLDPPVNEGRSSFALLNVQQAKTTITMPLNWVVSRESRTRIEVEETCQVVGV